MSTTSFSPTFLLHVQAICAAEALGLQIAAFAAPWFFFILPLQLAPSGPPTAVTYALYLDRLLVTPAGGASADLYATSVAPQYQALGRAALATLILGFLASLFLLACLLARVLALAPPRAAAPGSFLPRALALAQDGAVAAIAAWASTLCTAVGLALGCSFIGPGNTGASPVALDAVDYTGRTCAIAALVVALLTALLASRAHYVALREGRLGPEQAVKVAANPLASSAPQEQA